MSISFGIYDFFGNLIPGLLYLYGINESLRALNQSYLDLANLDKFGPLVLVGVCAYILGHLANSFTYSYWYRLFYRKSISQQVLAEYRERYPNVKISFGLHGTGLLLSIIRYHKPEQAETIERLRANYIMLRKISFGLALYVVLNMVLSIQAGNRLPYAIQAGMGVLFSALALLQAHKNDIWYYRDIFYASLNLGSCVEEVLETSRHLVLQSQQRSTPRRRSVKVRW